MNDTSKEIKARINGVIRKLKKINEKLSGDFLLDASWDVADAVCELKEIHTTLTEEWNKP